MLTRSNLAASGVAVGSSIGHALGSLFSGSGSAPAAESQQADSAVANQANEAGYQSGGWNAQSCETDAKSFTKCLDEHSGNMQICGWYLEQLVSYYTFSATLAWMSG